MPDWKTFEVVDAPGPTKDSGLRLTVSQEFIDRHFEISRLTPIFQMNAHIYGRLPDINLISQVANSDPTTDLTTLNDAVACFEGIERPHDDERNGDTVLVYVLQPAVTIERTVSMACQASAAVPPKSSVLTVLVRTNLDLQDGEGAIDGSITRIEWVVAGNDGLPKSHETRYTTQHWTKT
ncbi:hypothetical protein [uncultured Roseobacter sp.]|uniref:hypothetical protein n=1 Tax=uncultured Roseobacter sp. TaxID=114847 RepID=UPI002605E221|nr:hypothetical protein [uncultured Roseobacter sp.]